MIRILFVCHGNICRSPMAEFIFKDMVRKQGLEGSFSIASAATSTEEIGNHIYPPAKRELTKNGVPFDSAKCARQMTRSDYEHYDYLIGMDRMNMRNMERIAGKREKLFKLLSFAGMDRDVADPWYTDNFTEAYEDILRGCEAFLKYLRKQGEIGNPGK